MTVAAFRDFAKAPKNGVRVLQSKTKLTLNFRSRYSGLKVHKYMSEIRANCTVHWHICRVTGFSLLLTVDSHICGVTGFSFLLTVDSHICRVTGFSHSVRCRAPVDATILDLNVAYIYMADDVTV